VGLLPEAGENLMATNFVTFRLSYIWALIALDMARQARN
jgi:hypothetical protein